MKCELLFEKVTSIVRMKKKQAFWVRRQNLTPESVLIIEKGVRETPY